MSQLFLALWQSPSAPGAHRLSPGSQLTVQDLAAFQPEVAAPLEMALGNYTLYSPPPPAGGAILNFILNVLQGKVSSQSFVSSLPTPGGA